MASPEATTFAEPTKQADESLSSTADNEDATVEQLGYKPELKRTFSLLGMVGFSFSIVTSWTALGGVLIIGVQAGGPPVMIWSWLCLCVATLAVAASMAEMCSAWPVASGQVAWVSMLAPAPVRRGLAYLTGWFLLIGVLAMGAVNNSVATSFILAMAKLNHPAYVIERWHHVLITYLLALLAAASNIYLPHLLNRISRLVLVWNLGSFVVITVTILALNPRKNRAAFVFADFQNLTGGFPNGYAALLGILQAAFGMCCYDAPARMVEELHDPRRQAPRAILLSVLVGLATGFAFLVALAFCLGPDIAATAASPTGSPLVQILLDSVGSSSSPAGATALTACLALIGLGCANSLAAEGSRAIWAFARDRGLPFSSFLSTVHPAPRRVPVPVRALVATAAVQAAFSSLAFLPAAAGFDTVVAIATQGFYLSYLVPVLLRTLRLLRVPGFRGKEAEAEEVLRRAPFRIHRPFFSIALHLLASTFLLFCCVTFLFPMAHPVTGEDMNYCLPAVGGVVLIAAGHWWLGGGRGEFCVFGQGGGVQEGVVVGRDVVEGREGVVEGGVVEERGKRE